MMNQADIETFLMLVKTQNITKTAENLFVSQPTVSHRLKSLEEELHVPLMVRRKGYKKVELTPKGEEFALIADRWLALLQETQALQNQDDDLNLRIGCTNTLNSTIFIELYRQITNNPDLHMRLNIETHYSYQLYEYLENHAIDLGFVYHHLHFKNIIAEPILKEKMYIVQENSTALRKTRLRVEEMDPKKEVSFIWEANYQIWHDQMISKGKGVYLEVDEYDLLSEFLKDKGHWAIAPLSVVERLIRQQPIYVSEIVDARKPPERITYMIINKDLSETRTKAVTVFRRQMDVYFEKRGLKTDHPHDDLLGEHKGVCEF